MSEQYKVDAQTGRLVFPPARILSPVPAVMVSCAEGRDDKGFVKPNIITIAWAGTVCSDPPMLSISIRKSRFSYPLIEKSGEFVVNLVSETLLDSCDFCGVRSGRDVDKFKHLKLTAVSAEGLLSAPAIKEAPLSLACKVNRVVELGSHDMFIAEIVSVTVAPEFLDVDGKICLEKASLVGYVHGNYFALGRALGFFGYSVASKDAFARRMKALDRMNADKQVDKS